MAAAVQVPPLTDILAEIPDPRQSQGRRHPLSAMLTLLCLAVLCGRRNVLAVSEWGPQYGEEYAAQLGFEEHGYPSTVTWYRVLGSIDVAVFERKLASWTQQVMNALAGPEGRQAVSIDGKTLRGSRKQGAEGSHLLAAATHWLSLVLAEVAVDEKTNELGEIQKLLMSLALEGKVVTLDALLAQRAVAETIVEAGGDYVMAIKENQPRTRQAIAEWFVEQPPVGMPANGVAETREKAHGRVEYRRIETTTALNDYLGWPGLAQAFMVTRRRVSAKTGEVQKEVHYGLSSLSPEDASARDLLTYTRQHWTIENRLHWVRDVDFSEDQSQLRVGTSHQLMAAVRNLVIGLIRLQGHDSVASALRAYAARPRDALHVLECPLRE